MHRRSLSFLSFDDVWKMRIEHPYSLFVKDGDLLWSCGQCPLDSIGQVLDPGDLLKQAVAVVGFIRRFIAEMGCDVSDVGRLVVYYVKTKDGDAEALINLFGQQFGKNVLITPVAIPYFYYDGMLVEVDVFGASSDKEHRKIIDQKSGIELEVVDTGTLLWANLSARNPSVDRGSLSAALDYLATEAGLSTQNMLSVQWFVGDESALALVDAAILTGLCWSRCDVVNTEFDGYWAMAEFTFCKAPVSHHSVTMGVRGTEDGSIEVNFRHCDDRFYIDGRDNSGTRGLVAQTEAIMTAIEHVLKASGLGFAAVRKSTTYYVSSSSAEELHDNMAVRNRYYSKPGPASTGLPVKSFCRSDALISVKLIG